MLGPTDAPLGMAKIVLDGSLDELGPVDGHDIDDGKCCLYYPAQWLCKASPVLKSALTSVILRTQHAAQSKSLCVRGVSERLWNWASYIKSTRVAHVAGGWKGSASLEVDLSDQFHAEDFGEFLNLLMVTHAAPFACVSKTFTITDIAASIERVCLDHTSSLLLKQKKKRAKAVICFHENRHSTLHK
jgi:hypothetical protein